ncbi:chitin elicitor receptor kinase 1-like isoform X1 [Typha latifolia]|uniref:chitin elicitor receptor kinase 1-like isoform X1 n=1 Tax=Typha latifolia TaxID=4733 RepID=UPI003C30600F
MPNLGSRSLLFFAILVSSLLRSESFCQRGCDLALGSYYVSPKKVQTLSNISALFGLTADEVHPYNPNITKMGSIPSGSRVTVYFPCDCVDGEYLAHTFPYVFQHVDTYDKVADSVFAGLTTGHWLAEVNSYPELNVPDWVTINVTVNCSCGNGAVSREYGLFVTYPLRSGDNLSSVAAEYGLYSQKELIQAYNPGVDFGARKGIVFIPAKDPNGKYHSLPMLPSRHRNVGVIAGTLVAATTLLVLAICFYVYIYRPKKKKKASFLPSTSDDSSLPLGNIAASDRIPVPTPQGGNSSPLIGVADDKSVEFSYEELRSATNDFSMSNKIGQGGFGSVYYAVLRGEKTAVKKMDMDASKEFIAEVKVLSHVHHLNLVRLVGYCIEGSLFLVYEYIENGNLGQHLHGSVRDPLSWAARLQIALDSARGLEYIHEHIVPLYVHCDIKSANILIDKKFRGKVADFGLTKLTEAGKTNSSTRVVGTFGYIPAEYVLFGDVSPKVDVYAFGVVLYELISAKEAIVMTNESATYPKGLAALFEDVLNKKHPEEDLRKLVDPRLGDDYRIDSILQMAQLARACTQDNPKQRPAMKHIVVALTLLSSSSERWNMNSFLENQGLINLMSER